MANGCSPGRTVWVRGGVDAFRGGSVTDGTVYALRSASRVATRAGAEGSFRTGFAAAIFVVRCSVADEGVVKCIRATGIWITCPTRRRLTLRISLARATAEGVKP